MSRHTFQPADSGLYRLVSRNMCASEPAYGRPRARICPLGRGNMEACGWDKRGRVEWERGFPFAPFSTDSCAILEKNVQMFWRFRIKLYLCIAFETKDIGRLAQLVQSVCLTSRGSGVRIPQRPRKKSSHEARLLLLCNLLYLRPHPAVRSSIHRAQKNPCKLAAYKDRLFFHCTRSGT